MMRKAISPTLECDCLIFDLEDSVPLAQKENARELVRKLLAEIDHSERSQSKKQICVRINQLDSPLSRSDIESLANQDALVNFVVPKSEYRGIKNLFRKSGKHIIPIIESSTGFLQMEEIAGSKGVDALAYGAADMALSMRGSVENYQDNEYIRTRLAIIARAYGLDPIDQVFFDLDNDEGFRKEASKAKNLGYSGKLLIHPSQIKIANEVFGAWSQKEIDWARRVIQAYEGSVKDGRRGAIRLNGELIDAVHYKLALDILNKDGVK
jgi:citrate lyase subunit beta / citryl-CoA lyase